MRDLTVYFCKECGHYASYQLPKNAVCPKCNVTMLLLELSYLEFMDLDYEERDSLISQKIIEASSSYVHKICAPSKFHNKREIIGQLVAEVTKLEAENTKLNQTIDWMHQTIWDQLRKTKSLERELQELKEHQQNSKQN